MITTIEILKELNDYKLSIVYINSQIMSVEDCKKFLIEHLEEEKIKTMQTLWKKEKGIILSFKSNNKKQAYTAKP